MKTILISSVQPWLFGRNSSASSSANFHLDPLTPDADADADADACSSS